MWFVTQVFTSNIILQYWKWYLGTRLLSPPWHSVRCCLPPPRCHPTHAPHCLGSPYRSCHLPDHNCIHRQSLSEESFPFSRTYSRPCSHFPAYLRNWISTIAADLSLLPIICFQVLSRSELCLSTDAHTHFVPVSICRATLYVRVVSAEAGQSVFSIQYRSLQHSFYTSGSRYIMLMLVEE